MLWSGRGGLDDRSIKLILATAWFLQELNLQLLWKWQRSGSPAIGAFVRGYFEELKWEGRMLYKSKSTQESLVYYYISRAQFLLWCASWLVSKLSLGRPGLGSEQGGWKWGGIAGFSFEVIVWWSSSNRSIDRSTTIRSAEGGWIQVSLPDLLLISSEESPRVVVVVVAAVSDPLDRHGDHRSSSNSGWLASWFVQAAEEAVAATGLAGCGG